MMQNSEDNVVVALGWGIFLLILGGTLVIWPLREAVLIIISDVLLFGLGFGLSKMLSRPDRGRWVLGVWLLVGLGAIFGNGLLRLRGYKWATGMSGAFFLYGNAMARLPSLRASVENPKAVQGSKSGNAPGSDES